MSSIVIALPKIEDARKIRSVLERHGFAVASVSGSGRVYAKGFRDAASGICESDL